MKCLSTVYVPLVTFQVDKIKAARSKINFLARPLKMNPTKSRNWCRFTVKIKSKPTLNIHFKIKVYSYIKLFECLPRCNFYFQFLEEIID